MGQIGLNAMQTRFAKEYLIDLNATSAARRAGYSKRSAGSQGQRLLTNPKVQELIQSLMAKRAKRTEVTADRVLQEIANIGFANCTDFVKIAEKIGRRTLYDADGKPTGEEEYTYQIVDILNDNEIADDKRAAIAGIKQGANGIEIKLNDKIKALELMGKHIGLFNDKLDVSGNVTLDVDSELIDKLAELAGYAKK